MINKKLCVLNSNYKQKKKASIYNNDTKNSHINKMKINDNQKKNDSIHVPNNPTSQLLTTCNHKIDLLLRRQNCHLPSAQCKEKCSHKHVKRQHYDQHQYSTENELRKFMTNKIEHKNKPFMMEKQIIKEEILRQINHAEQTLKTIKDGLMKQIDKLYYGAVKSGNDKLTAKGMDKFFSSQLELLTCHQVYCLFSFKPLIQEQTNSKISSGLKLVKQDVTEMTKGIEKANTSIYQRILMIQSAQQSHMIAQKDRLLQKKNIDSQKPRQKKNTEKMEQEIQQKKGSEKIITIDLTPKHLVQRQKRQQKPFVKQVLRRKQEKQQRKDNEQQRKGENQKKSEEKMQKKQNQQPRKEQKQSRKDQTQVRKQQKQLRNEQKYPGKQHKQVRKQHKQVKIDEKLVRKQEKQISKPQKQLILQDKTISACLIKRIEKKPEKSDQVSRQTDHSQIISLQKQQNKNQSPAVSQDKYFNQTIQKNIEKPTVKQVPKLPVKQNTFKPSDYVKYTQKMSDNNMLLEKCKMFQKYSQQSSKAKDLNFKYQNEATKHSHDLKKNIYDPKKLINQKQTLEKPKIIPDDQPFQVLLNNFKALGSLDKMFLSNEGKKQLPKISLKTQKPISLKQKITSQFMPSQTQQISLKKQTKIGNDEQTIKKNIFSDLKRTSEALKEKWINEGHPEGRKIVKIGNQFPHSQVKTDSSITNKPINNDNKIIPEHAPLPEKSITQNNKMINLLPSNSETKPPTPAVISQTNKIETKEPKQKQIEKVPDQKVQSKPQHILTGSDKILLELVRKSSQTQIEQEKSTKMDFELQIQSSIETPTFKPTNQEQNIDKLNLDQTIQQKPKQLKIPQKPRQQVKKQQSNLNDILNEVIKNDQKELNQSPRSFLSKPSTKRVQQQNVQLISSQKPVTQRQASDGQIFGSGVKKIRLMNPGTRVFGRSSQNPIYNVVELFQKGQQGLKQLQQKKQEKRQEYNKNSLLGQMERANGNSMSYGLDGLKQNNVTPRQSSTSSEVKPMERDSSKPLGLDENKISSKKLNLISNYYHGKLPSWYSKQTERDT